MQPYVYAAAAGGDAVADLIGRLANGTVQVMVFTSSPQVDRLYEVAAERGLEEILRQGLERCAWQQWGRWWPTTCAPRRSVDVCPEQGFVMKNLVQHLVRHRHP